MAYVLTVPSGTVASDLSGFPVRVDLSHMPSGWWSEVTTHGSGAIRVRQDGVDVPRHAVVVNTGTSTGTLFFKASLDSAADNEFTVDVVSGATEPAVTDSIGRNAVWSDYAAVSIYSGGSATNVTGGAAPATTGTPTYSGDGVEVTGTQWLRYGSLSKYTAWTAGASVVLRSSSATNRNFMSYTESGSNSDDNRETFSARDGATLASWNSTNSWLGAAPISVGARKRFVHTHENGVARKNYVDGALESSSTSAAVRPAGSEPAMLVVGNAEFASANPFYGAIDYAYLRSGVLSSDWLAAEYESWESPATFYSVTETTEDPVGAFNAVTPAPVSALTGKVLVQGEFSALTPAPSSALVGGEPAGAIAGQFGATTPAPTSALEGFVEFVPFEPPMPDLGITFELSNTVTYPPTPADPSTVAIGRTAVSVPE